jgi:phospholipid/cholesterol/gamma-HCH transport system substrate-binding protein
MRSVSTVGRVAAILGLVAAVGAVGFFLFGLSSYTVKAVFLNAGQVVAGNNVQIAGTKVGSVSDIKITPNGQAEIFFTVQDEYTPLRRGTRAVIRQASLSGISNRYIDLQLPEGNKAQATIPSGGAIGIDETVTQVELDEVFNLLDPVARVAVQQFFRGQARQYRGKGKAANAGFKYLSPALSTSSELFDELDRDSPLLARFLQDSDRFNSALASRDDELTNLIKNLNVTTRALGDQRIPLMETLSRFPDFLRTANTTFVNLRGTLDELDPLVKASRPAARRLPAFFRELRPFARNARPTLRDLSQIVRRPGADNDLVELNRTFPPLARVALDSTRRNGKRRKGAFPEASRALRAGAPIMAFARPYTPDLLGWFDDFSHTGSYDALGGFSRTQIYFNLFNQGLPADEVGDLFGEVRALNKALDDLQFSIGAATAAPGTPLDDMEISVPGGTRKVGDVEITSPLKVRDAKALQDRFRDLRNDIVDRLLTPLEDRTDNPGVRQGQYRRCPGGADAAAADGSNVFSEGEQEALDCREADRGTGEF